MSLDCFIELFIELMLKGDYLMRFNVKLEQLFEAVKAIIQTLPTSRRYTNDGPGQPLVTQTLREWPKRHKHATPMYYFEMPAGTPSRRSEIDAKRADLGRLVRHRDAVPLEVRKGNNFCLDATGVL